MEMGPSTPFHYAMNATQNRSGSGNEVTHKALDVGLHLVEESSHANVLALNFCHTRGSKVS